MRKVFLALACFALLAGAVSSTEAQGKLSKCIKDAYPDLAPSLKPLGVGSDYYWTFSYSLSSPRKIVVAVNDASGDKLTDEVLLKGVASVIFDQGLAEEVKSKGYAASLLQATVTQAAQQAARQVGTLEVFREQTEKKYPQLSFAGAYDALSTLSTKATDLESTLRDAAGYQQSFEADNSDALLSALLSAYNASFAQLDDLIEAYEDYQKSISDLESEVYKSSIPDPDNKNIYSNLENLRDIGISQLYSKAKASPPRLLVKKFSSLKDVWVNDTVSSYFFIDTQCNAEEQYYALQQDYSFVAASEQVIRQQGFGAEFEDVKTKYDELARLRSQRSHLAYKAMLEKIPAIQASISLLKERFTKNTATPAPKPKQGDSTDLLLIAALIIIAAYAVTQYQKGRELISEPLTEPSP